MNLQHLLKTSALLLLSAPSFAQQRSYNLDMEQLDAAGMPDKWETRFSTALNAGYEVTLDSLEKQHGKYALSIERKSDGKFGVCSVIIPAEFSGHRIKLSGYLKTKDVADGFAGMWLRVDGNNTVLAFDNMQDRGVTGTNDWKQFEIELNYDEEQATKIYAGALLTGKGKAWVDNLSISLDDVDIAKAPLLKREPAKAALDTAFNNSSGISSISYQEGQLKRLTNLGEVWGFLKYYHPAIANGEYNWDAELFRFLPAYTAAATDKEAYLLMEKWVDKLGKVPPCSDCKVADTAVKLAPGYGHIFDKNNLPATLVTKLQFIRDNHSSGSKQYYVDMAPGVGNPVFRNEAGYIHSAYPDAGIRLLALYRYWNMIQYFYPNRHLTGDWNKVLPGLVPVLLGARNAEEYTLACQRMVTYLNDTHGQLISMDHTLEKIKGDYILPVQLKQVQGKMIVADYNTEDSVVRAGMHKGDVVTAIDGVPVETLIEKYKPLTPASNEGARTRNMFSYYGYLALSRNKNVQLDFIRDGKKMSFTGERPSMESAYAQKEHHQAYYMMPGNIGYIYPALLTGGSLDSVKNLMQHAKGIVIDMRCYPGTFMPFSYGEWLKPHASDFVRFSVPSLKKPGLFTYTNALPNGSENPESYKGKVVIIVNEQTQSQAEYTTMALCTVSGAVVIGSTTSGADGNVSSIMLPGNFTTLISGIGIYYPDNTETQRVGVKIDEVVTPTIKGITDGKDELLERAVQIVEKG